MKRWLKENRKFIFFLLCLGFVRLAIADWNPIPSGSMRPTLLEGDVVLVNRLAYDFKVPLTEIALFELGTPRRGDVVVFFSPKDGVRLIKRLVALPGDAVEMRNEIVYINGLPCQYAGIADGFEPRGSGSQTPAIRATEQLGGKPHAVQFLPDVPALRSFPPVIVPDGSYFFLGDNRDDSADSRYIGVVPRRLIVGRAHHIFVSADIQGNWQPRLHRIGEPIQ